MSQYASTYPSSTSFKSAYKQFFESFYKISDTPDGHETYAAQFTSSATVIMASKKVQGYDEIVSMRKAMWEKVRSRSHKPLKVFPFGEDGADEAMLYGTVDYELKDGRSAAVPWAARAHLVEEEGKVKMDFYQVYLDSAAQNPSK